MTVFAVAKLVVINDLWEIDEVDPRLLETCASYVPYSKMSFTLWIKESCVPQELDNIFTVTKVLSLKTVVKQFFNQRRASAFPSMRSNSTSK